MVFPTTPGAVAERQMRHDAQMLYLMIKPDQEAAAAMDALRRQHGLARKYAVERLHMTLVRFGDIRLLVPGALDLISRAAESLQAEPFKVTLDRISGNALVGSRMQKLRDFRRALVTRLNAFGIETQEHGFNPHASLTYEGWMRRNIPVPPIAWRVRQLLLINSIHGKGHEPLGSWTLDPRQGSLSF